MVQESLVEYCRSLLSQGYDVDVIRTTLVNAGYSVSDANSALRSAGASVPSQFSLSGRLVWYVFGGLALLVVFVLLVLFLTRESSEPLTVSSSLVASRVSAGDEVVVNVDIGNPSNRDVSVSLEVKVSGPQGVIDVKSESLDIVSSRRVPVRVVIPSNSPSGQYGVDVMLSYGPITVSSSALFEVGERVNVPVGIVEVPVESAKEVSLACPASCDDLNFCTTDECVNGVCVYTRVVPCCGNGVCEEGEEGSCGVDCAPSESPQSVIDNALSLASSNTQGAVQLCDSLGQSFYVNSCLSDVASASQNIGVCNSISSSDVRDSCLISFAHKGDFSVCSQIQDVYLRTSCESLKGWQSRGVPKRPS